MSEDYKAEWLAKLVESVDRFGLVFVQLGAAQSPLRSMFNAEELVTASVSDYLVMRREGIPGGVVVVTDLEAVRVAPEGSTLNVLRERVMTDLDAGLKIILLSRSPRVAYAPVPGSSLLEDAAFVHGPLVPVPIARTSDPSMVLPDRFENSTDLDELLVEMLTELGVEVCASLDHAMFEAMLDPDDVFATLTIREIEALQGASLAKVSSNKASWSMPKRLGELKNALSDVLAAHTEAQSSVAEVFGGLWALERSIRKSIRARAKETWGNSWRQQVLGGDLTTKVLERASFSAYAAAKTVKEIRDPLEWLSLGELLDIRTMRPDIGDLGVDPPIWKLFAAEVLPIRNRLSHMRLLTPDDLPTVLKWSKVMERKLS